MRVVYDVVRETVPRLWEQGAGGRKIDYMVHIGMATGRNYYSVERRGHRDGYGMQDVDGKLLKDEERRKKEGKDWIWAGMPEELLTDIDIDDVWRRWRTLLPVCSPGFLILHNVCIGTTIHTDAFTGSGHQTLRKCRTLSLRFHLLFKLGISL